MKFSKETIGSELKKEIDKGYNIPIISTWACNIFVASGNENSLELDDILRHISLMDAGPEFEYTEQELRMLAELLIKPVEDPFKQINDIKFNKFD